MLLFRGLTIAVSCGELGELVSEGLIIRLSGVRVPVGPPIKSMQQAQRFLGAHAAVYNLFNLGRHLVSAENYWFFRQRAFASWEKAVAI